MNDPDPTIDPYDSVDQLHVAAADAFVDLVGSAVRDRGRCRVSLSGGSTPKRFYEILAERDLPWEHIDWFWGDERNVPPDDAQSNAKMVRDTLLNPVDAPEQNVHVVPVDVENPAAAARAYEATLRSHFSGDEFPIWDLVLLGMGDDAHTASLFPHTAAVQQCERWFVENLVPKFDAYRYTLTAPAINSGRQVWFLIAGENKRAALQRVLQGTESSNQAPARLVRPTRWFVTADAMPAQS